MVLYEEIIKEYCNQNNKIVEGLVEEDFEMIDNIFKEMVKELTN